MNGLAVAATWNVNSIRARREHLLDWLARERPDYLCLQELKAPDGEFPVVDVEAAGYHVMAFGQKTYNGVAILSLNTPLSVEKGMGDDDPQARLLTCQFPDMTVISAYFPNGSEPDSDKYQYKKEWLGRFTTWLGKRLESFGPTILCGDFNIAPTAQDVGNESEWEGSVIYNPQMRQAFSDLQALGLVDVFRSLNPLATDFSWWDYRMNAFRRNLGLRLDYIMATANLAGAAVSARIDRAERAMEKPSDHAPVIASFDMSRVRR
ncbi:MAG TPA: exodeoxyribonuclease III [Myxococcota bacterium]|nr:exodeoxyribonuclease III [Myxococcota bacterium]HOA12474.1 exodeoxyribonuclease III [Myxococcota bacterium]HOC99894.1 exodeoxyribonuclease III [Myxococcota bacterium]HOH75779.1 exodeoxyribonuclease III [Myxococcota bacterium]HPV03275.1 exodeoxyribonuclease III [Myxococcota bacterium]